MHIDQTYKLKNNNPKYNYFKCIQYIQQQGKILYGSSYHIHSLQRQQVYRLLVYATASKEECTLYGIDLKKGLLVSGPESSGKTSLMHLLKPFLQLKQQYLIRSSREIVFCCQRFGKTTLEKYLFKNTDYCIDDLGQEPVVSYSRGNIEIVRQLITLRLQQCATTHIITRFNRDELQKKYGKDFCNLLYQNLNVVEFPKSFNQ